MGEDKPSNTNEFLEKISKYKLMIPAIGVIIGFIYVQGLFSPAMQGHFTPGYLLRAGFILPISSEAYIGNGLFFLFEVFLLLLIAYISLAGLSKIFLFLLDRFQFNITQKASEFLLNFLGFFYFLFPPLSIKLLYCLHEKSKSYQLANLWFYDTIFIVVLLGGYFLYQKQQQRKTTNQTIELFGLLFLVTAVFSSILAIYYNGHVTQSIKINYALRDHAGLEFVKIYQDSNPAGYYLLNISKDFFIGWNDKKRSITIIPITKIDKIEKWHAIIVKKHPILYEPNLTDAQIQYYTKFPVLEAKTIINVVNHFYTFRTGFIKKKDNTIENSARIEAQQVLALMTKKCQDKFVEPIFSAPILNYKWRKTKTYHDNNLSSFNGYDLSLPETDKKNQRYTVYIHECWDTTDRFVRFTLIKTKTKQWLIDAININETSFQFKKAVELD